MQSFIAVFVLPVLPQPGEREWRSAAKRNEVRRFA
jgi:hypothetical protein